MLKYTLLALFSFCLMAGYAQEHISGIVLDARSKEPLTGVNVFVEEATEGVVTDLDGKFSLALQDGERWLRFSYLGYQTRTCELTPGETFLTIELELLPIAYDTVIVFDPETYEEQIRVVAVSAYGISASPAARMEYAETVSYSPGKKTTGTTGQFAPGQLTAGEVNDFSKWVLWNDKSQEELRMHQKVWNISPSERFSVMIQDQNGIPVTGVRVFLVNETKDTVWSAVTDNTGRAELWAGMFGQQVESEHTYSIAANYGKKNRDAQKAIPFHEGINHITLKRDCNPSNVVDAVFMVDATGSMSDEINYLKAELNDVIEKVKEKNPGLALNLGSVFYRDHGDEYITKRSALSGDISQTIGFIKEQSANGGGDGPEAFDEALLEAINDLNWSDQARARILFMVLDAPPHQTPENIERLQKAAWAAAQKGIKLVPVTGSGIDKSAEYLMRSLALCTNGTYVFLTDHSGIGNPHIEPTTDSYDVEKLNDLLVRLFGQFTAAVDCDKNLPLAEEVSDTTEIQGLIQSGTGALPQAASEETTPEAGPFSCRFFPNPTPGLLHVEVEGEIKELFLTDLSGKILQRIGVEGRRRFEMDISPYPSGIYSVTYFGENDRRVSGRIVLMK